MDKKSDRIIFFRKALSFFVLFNAVSVFIQLFFWYLFNNDLDYSLMLGITDTAQRSIFYGGVYRPTGFYAEPSIYSSITLSIVVLRYALTTKFDSISLLGILSSCLTLSTVALLISFMLIVVVYFRFKISDLIYATLLLFVFVYLSFDALSMRLDLLLSGVDGSSNVKIEVLNYWFSRNELFLFGFSLIDKSRSNFGEFIVGLGDLGIFVNNLMFFGLFVGGIVNMLLLLLFFKGSIRVGLLCIIVTIKLSSFTFPATIFFICMVSYINSLGVKSVFSCHNNKRQASIFTKSSC
ncbi:hypothetical protein P0Y67_04020 [Photobacterium sp. SP02]|uniref:hypothetical protein n=1 Tax=Photobacterium sp. SP02 TaxID=3032280 RepID=UPI003144E788